MSRSNQFKHFPLESLWIQSCKRQASNAIILHVGSYMNTDGSADGLAYLHPVVSAHIRVLGLLTDLIGSHVGQEEGRVRQHTGRTTGSRAQRVRRCCVVSATECINTCIIDVARCQLGIFHRFQSCPALESLTAWSGGPFLVWFISFSTSIKIYLQCQYRPSHNSNINKKTYNLHLYRE